MSRKDQRRRERLAREQLARGQKRERREARPIEPDLQPVPAPAPAGAAQEHRSEHRSAGTLAPPWPKGVSGNPGGRPKGRSVMARLRELYEQDTFQGVQLKNGKQIADLVAEVILKAELGGDRHIIKLALQYCEPREAPEALAPPEPVDLTIDPETAARMMAAADPTTLPQLEEDELRDPD